MGLEKNEYPKASRKFFLLEYTNIYWRCNCFIVEFLYNGAILTYCGFFLLLIAFCAPYWVQSFEGTFNEFEHMGLWEYCFNHFRYPYYQFDHLFNGCHHVFSSYFHVIREFLLPAWLMAVQAFVTMSFMLSFSANCIMALQLCRWPLNFVLKYEYILSAIDFVCVVTTSKYKFNIHELIA